MSGFAHVRVVGVVALASWLVCVVSADAVTIVPGVYQLGSHPDGGALPPPYGLRLDELYDVTGGRDSFTFDFSHPQSDVKLTYNGIDTIVISGHAFGGRDAGSDYDVNPVTGLPYLGVYDIAFTYNVGVQLVPGDDDVWTAAASHSNFGSITTPLSDVFSLSDIADGNYTFRFGDDNDDNGHRGHPGISGWGWMAVDGHYASVQDWIFTAELIPEPATAMIVVSGFGLLRIRRRSPR